MATLDLYVSPAGRDTWTGRLPEPDASATDGPFATVGRAQAAVRELGSPGARPGPVTVHIRGVHRLDTPLVFTPDDSGTASSPVTYTSYPGETPVLSGGRPIASWQPGDGPLWTAHLPEVQSGQWYFRQLFVAGRRACRTRRPKEGYLRVEALLDDNPDARWSEGVDRFRFLPGDLASYSDPDNVEVVVVHAWNMSRVRIASVDVAERVVTFTGPTQFRPLAWDPNQRYYVENARELLDAPGEWYLDRCTGTLTYWPLPGEDMTRVEVVAPRLTELVRFDGDPDAGRFVEHVRLDGLSFQHADWSLSATGYGDSQAAATVPAVVSGAGACNCTVQRCEIAHVGTYAVWLSRGCKHNRIVRNHIHDMGAGGVRIGDTRMADTDVAESSHNLVHNNYIHDGSQVYAAGVGVWVAQSSHNTVSHNEIHSLNYSGVSVGWNWGYEPNRTHHNTVEHNHIHHVVRGVLSDGAGIYTLGVQPGSVLRHNRIHDVFPYTGRPAPGAPSDSWPQRIPILGGGEVGMAWCIYLDQATSGLVVEHNVCFNSLTGSIMDTASPGNIVRNNVFALSAWDAVWRWAWQQEPDAVFEHNIIYVTQGNLFHADGGRDDTRSVWDHNLFWRTDGQELRFYDDTFAQWQARGMDRHSMVADPRFVDADQYDFRLRPDSPAPAIGFEPIDPSGVGLEGPPEWVDLPRQAVFPPTVFPPPVADVQPPP